MSNIINQDSENIKSFMFAINSILDSMDNILKSYHPILNGERYLTEGEVSKLLHISKRTLHDYRHQGKIPYYQIGGKILHKESDIEKFLNDGYLKAFE